MKTWPGHDSGCSYDGVCSYDSGCNSLAYVFDNIGTY